MRRRLALAGGVCLAALAVAGPASASLATVDCPPGTVCVPSAKLNAAPGERNRVTVGLSAGRVFFRDTGAPVTAGTGCVQVDANTASCLSRPRIVVAAGDLDDTVLSTAPGVSDVDGGSGRDALKFRDGGGGVLSGGSDRDRLLGGSGADDLNGGSGNDTLRGGAGDDELVGNSGDDRLFGGAGDDFADGGRGNDRVDGGTGADTLIGRTGRDRIGGGPGGDRLLGGRGNDRLFGGSGRDFFRGSAGNDTIGSRDGRRERVSCGTGLDTVRVDARDILTGCGRPG